MARIIVMTDAKHLKEGVNGTILYAEEVTPEHLDDLRCSEQILERLEGAVRGERVTAGPLYEQSMPLTARPDGVEGHGLVRLAAADAEMLRPRSCRAGTGDQRPARRPPRRRGRLPAPR